ncbi:AraC family transcriptional regulator [uncultured Sphaerochaeta sp.]|uniref:AraC family transcriptional regulator n=1 Tax=uncultured Sphaerochaeta sp. TaxID=886478 RepID=UPI002A0A5CED|nr:AraC family transcriptional regulator [uncultured Sphaerochaeta sp.]
MNSQLIREKGEGFPKEKLFVVAKSSMESFAANPALRGFMITDAGYFPSARFHLRQRLKGSEQNIFIFCEKGKGFVSINEQVTKINAGQAITIPEKTAHMYGASKDDPWTIYWFHFTGDFAPTYVARALSGKGIQIPEKNQQVLIDLFSQIFIPLSHGITQRYLLTSSSAAALILSLAYEQEYLTTDTLNIPGVRVVEDLIAYTQNHLTENITLETFSQRSRYSPSRIIQLFKEVTGYSPILFVQHQRMQRACYYLDSTQEPVNRIAEYVGFSDQFYFSRVFKKIIGVSPREYRSIYHK